MFYYVFYFFIVESNTYIKVQDYSSKSIDFSIFFFLFQLFMIFRKETFNRIVLLNLFSFMLFSYWYFLCMSLSFSRMYFFSNFTNVTSWPFKRKVNNDDIKRKDADNYLSFNYQNFVANSINRKIFNSCELFLKVQLKIEIESSII